MTKTQIIPIGTRVTVRSECRHKGLVGTVVSQEFDFPGAICAIMFDGERERHAYWPEELVAA